MKTHFSCFQNSYSVTQWQVCNIAEIVGSKSQALSHPTSHSLFSFFFFLFFPFLLYFFFFLSSSLSVLLQSKKLILTNNSHRSLTRQSLTRRPTPTQAERSSTSIFDHTLKSSTMRSFSSSLLSYSFFDLVGASKLASTTTMDLRWKQLEMIRSGSLFFDLEALWSAQGTAPLEAHF